ncbi:MAG: hypothetical protein IKP77_00810 [Acholeplasmatales bacterium]|nr:hypothetical protein [Acholeplasmatales bacterium]
MFDKHDIKRNEYMLKGKFAKKGYDWWWHSFTAIDSESKEEKPFYIEFFTCNPKLAKDEPSFGQISEDALPSYLMVNVGTWGDPKLQLHRFFSLKKVKINGKAPFSIDADDCYLDEQMTFGSVNVTKEDSISHPEYMSDYGSISWNLKIEKIISFNVGYGASSLFRKMKAFEMFWHAEGMKSLFEGEIILNGKRYIVTKDTSYGYSDKNWGSNFTSPWVWLASSYLIDNRKGELLNNSCFDIGGGRPKIGPFALNRKLLSAFYIEGNGYEFNFSKFWTHTKTTFDSKELDDYIVWRVTQSNRKYIVEIEAKCKKSDMLFINYESPDGKKRHNRLWNGGNGTASVKIYKKKNKELIHDLTAFKLGCEYGEYDK